MVLTADSERILHRPYVVSWNLTYRCNLSCQHCYLDAGPKPAVSEAGFLDRSELSTEECLEVVDQISEFAPGCLTILTGGEPLLRRDIVEIIRYGQRRQLWMVVGTNGVRITENLVEILLEAGMRGLSLSLDSLEPSLHDQFRGVKGAWDNTVRGARILADKDVPFIVQTTVATHNREELNEIARFACEEMRARVWNLYFLVPSGRGGFISELTDDEYDRVLEDLSEIQKEYASRMLVNAKCAPHYIRHLLEKDPDSPFLKTYSRGAGGCPAGTHYLGIRPNGDVTPCPYLPLFGGNLKTAALRSIWDSSELFRSIRQRESLGGKCGECELADRCGGCRARAYGRSADLMTEDPICSHQPGSLSDRLVRLEPPVTYGQSATSELEWDEDARERMNRIPAFVRGMVIRKVEDYCRARGMARVTAEQLAKIRSRMPASRIFGRS